MCEVKLRKGLDLLAGHTLRILVSLQLQAKDHEINLKLFICDPKWWSDIKLQEKYNSDLEL